MVGWYCKVSLVDIQREAFLKVHALKREQYQERVYFNEDSSLKPLRKEFDSTDSEVQSEEAHSEYLSTQEHQKLEGKLKYRVK